MAANQFLCTHYAIDGQVAAGGRGFVWAFSGGSIVPTAPTAAGDIDGVTSVDGFASPAFAGLPVRVESGAAFSAGDSLKVNASGQFIAQGGSGTIVARALQAAGGSGVVVWAVIVSGR
jgi:hypothetical protein